MTPFTLPAKASTVLQRAIFKLEGPDAVRYLNGQCTQDVRLASSTTAVYALVTNFKGKIDGDCFIRVHEGALLIDAPLELRDDLFNRLDRYIIADDAKLADLTDTLEIVHSISAPGEGSWSCNRFGQDGSDNLYPKGEAPEGNLTDQELEKARITHRVPAWAKELDNDTLPPEAGLESKAISYTKGCYTGQEVISRMRSAGKTNKHLVLLEATNTLTAGSPLLCEGATPEKPAGWVTSACQIDDKQIALAYRKRKYQETNHFTDACVIS